MQRRQILIAGGASALFGSAGIRAENGVSDKEILLGQTGILTGPLGTTIKTLIAGAELAFGEANSQGGVAAGASCG